MSGVPDGQVVVRDGIVRIDEGVREAVVANNGTAFLIDMRLLELAQSRNDSVFCANWRNDS